MIKKILLILIISFSFLNISYGYYTNINNPQIEKVYNNFYKGLKSNQINTLLQLDKTIKDFLSKKGYNQKIVDLHKLNTNKIKELYSQNNIEKELLKNGFYIFYIDRNNKLLVDDEKVFYGYYGNKYISYGKGYILNENQISLVNQNQYKMKYAFYDKINKKIYITNDYTSKIEPNITELKNLVGEYFEVENDKFMTTFNGGVYTLGLSNFYTISDNKIPFLNNSFVLSNNIHIKNSALVYNKEKRQYYLGKVDKNLIGNTTYLSNIANKDLFYRILNDDSYFGGGYDKNVLEQIYNETTRITKNLRTNEEKIEVIYDYIVTNITYDYYKNPNNNKRFSGLDTFVLKKGVCDGYVKLFIYMLSFAGINNVDKIDGVSTNSSGNSELHSWVKIGNKYYDPTWDTNTKSKRLYYGLNKETILATRNEGSNSKILTLDEIFNRYLLASTKYDYEVLQGYKLFTRLGIKNYNDARKILTYNELLKKLGTIQPKGGERMFEITDEGFDFFYQLIIQLGNDFDKGKFFTYEGKNYFVLSK